MVVALAYGGRSVRFSLPDSFSVQELRLREVSPRQAPQTAIDEALDDPIGSRPMEEIFRRGERTVIVVPDGTRQARAPVYMPVLVDRLNRLGIADTDIRVLIATGSHRTPEPSEFTTLVGDSIAQRVKVIAHNSRDDAALVHLGDTIYGTPVWVNRRVVQCERLIVTGTITHHYFAGYGGGPKMIVPGCAGYETIRINHSRILSVEHGGIHPKCDLGVIEGNPVQEDIRDAMKFVAVDWLLHTILNAKGEIVEVVAGDLFAAHAAGCRQVDELYRVPVQERADIVVASCGGYPKDIDFIQAHKSLHNAFRALKPGGSLILFAECRNGIGSPTFLEWFQHRTPEAMTAAVVRDYKLNGHTAVATLQKATAARIVLVSELPAEQVRHMGLHPAANPTEAWRQASAGLPRDASVVVIPHASLTIPDPGAAT